MDALLMMFSRDLKRLSFDCVVPYNENDLLLIASPQLAFRLTNMVDDNNSYFSIKSIMMDNTVFACMDFNKRCGDFAQIMEAKIERYFVTQKINYLFFDDEEQAFLKTLIRKNTLSSSVIIYMRPDVRNPFKEIDYTDLSHKEHMDVSKYLRRLRVMAVVKPDMYYSMYVTNKRDAKERFDRLRKGKDKEFMQKMMKRYPKLKDIATKSQFKNYYRGLSKKYHPDVYDDHALFSQINTDFENLKETYWYKSLTDDVTEPKEQQEQPRKTNILLQASESER